MSLIANINNPQEITTYLTGNENILIEDTADGRSKKIMSITNFINSLYKRDITTGIIDNTFTTIFTLTLPDTFDSTSVLANVSVFGTHSATSGALQTMLISVSGLNVAGTVSGEVTSISSTKVNLGGANYGATAWQTVVTGLTIAVQLKLDYQGGTPASYFSVCDFINTGNTINIS